MTPAALARQLDTAAAAAAVTDLDGADPHDLEAVEAAARAAVHDICIAVPNAFGYCPCCGARMGAVPHKRGGDGCLAVIFAPAAAFVAFTRRVRVRAETLGSHFATKGVDR